MNSYINNGHVISKKHLGYIMESSGLMRDGLNAKTITQISNAISACFDEFNHLSFQKACLYQLDSLTMKQRVLHIIEALHQHLPNDFNKTATILANCKKHWQCTETLKGFAAWPLVDYVAVYGINHPNIALPLLKKLTPMFTAEFALRPFLIQHQALTLEYLQQWSNDKDEHVRRLVSEGSRPRLPWGIRLQAFCQDPSPILPLLAKLNNDTSAYVRKSVANSINDITKDNPQIAIALCKKWLPLQQAHTKWIIRHALRSLIKAGNVEVLQLLGFPTNIKITVQQFALNAHHLSVGESLSFAFTVHSNSDTSQALMIDYAIHHCKANQKTSIKVFKLKSLILAANSTSQITKQHSFKPISTRRYYEGTHKIDILINGNCVESLEFYLKV